MADPNSEAQNHRTIGPARPNPNKAKEKRSFAMQWKPNTIIRRCLISQHIVLGEGIQTRERSVQASNTKRSNNKVLKQRGKVRQHSRVWEDRAVYGRLVADGAQCWCHWHGDGSVSAVSVYGVSRCQCDAAHRRRRVRPAHTAGDSPSRRAQSIPFALDSPKRPAAAASDGRLLLLVAGSSNMARFHLIPQSYKCCQSQASGYSTVEALKISISSRGAKYVYRSRFRFPCIALRL